MDTAKALYEAKRDFDQALNAVNDAIRVLYHGNERERWIANDKLGDVYYSIPAHSQVDGYMKRADKLFRAEPQLEATMHWLVQAVVDAGNRVGMAKQADAEAKVLRQAERDAKKAYRGDRNLIIAMAAPRAEYRERALEYAEKWVVVVSNKLAENDWDLNVAYPYPGRDVSGRVAATMVESRNLADKFFGHEGRFQTTGVLKAVRRENISEITGEMADKMTAQYFDGYILKLSGKIGKTVKSAKLEGSLWSNSTLLVDCEDGEQQVWHTQCIFNRSVLGKVFNQWPTRRVS